MEHMTETVMPREAEMEAKILFGITEKIPQEKLYGFFQFIRGVNYGLDMANRPTAERPGA